MRFRTEKRRCQTLLRTEPLERRHLLAAVPIGFAEPAFAPEVADDFVEAAPAESGLKDADRTCDSDLKLPELTPGIESLPDDGTCDAESADSVFGSDDIGTPVEEIHIPESISGPSGRDFGDFEPLPDFGPEMPLPEGINPDNLPDGGCGQEPSDPQSEEWIDWYTGNSLSDVSDVPSAWDSATQEKVDNWGDSDPPTGAPDADMDFTVDMDFSDSDKSDSEDDTCDESSDADMDFCEEEGDEDPIIDPPEGDDPEERIAQAGPGAAAGGYGIRDLGSSDAEIDFCEEEGDEDPIIDPPEGNDPEELTAETRSGGLATEMFGYAGYPTPDDPDAPINPRASSVMLASSDAGMPVPGPDGPDGPVGPEF